MSKLVAHSEIKLVEKLISANFGVIKKLFITNAAQSDFPCIAFEQAHEFCKRAKLMDETYLTKEKLLEIFKICNVDPNKLEANPDHAL